MSGSGPEVGKQACVKQDGRQRAQRHRERCETVPQESELAGREQAPDTEQSEHDEQHTDLMGKEEQLHQRALRQQAHQCPDDDHFRACV